MATNNNNNNNNNNNISIKAAEISINKFNDQINQKLTMLRNFRSNSEKFRNTQNHNQLMKEQINSDRVVKQLKTLLIEIDQLRSKVNSSDQEKFEKLTSHWRNEALNEIKKHSEHPVDNFKTFPETSSEEFLPDADSNIQLHVDMNEFRRKQLDSKEAHLQEFENLQQDCSDIFEIYKNVNEMLVAQGEQVEDILINTEEAKMNVEGGTNYLKMAARYKKTMYPILGAGLGMIVCGPMGLLVGLQAGSLAVVTGGIGGYFGGKFLKNTEKSENIPVTTDKSVHLDKQT
ncbi:unnamed protein product [Diamesa serratosioi]